MTSQMDMRDRKGITAKHTDDNDIGADASNLELDVSRRHRDHNSATEGDKRRDRDMKNGDDLVAVCDWVARWRDLACDVEDASVGQSIATRGRSLTKSFDDGVDLYLSLQDDGQDSFVMGRIASDELASPVSDWSREA